VQKKDGPSWVIFFEAFRRQICIDHSDLRSADNIFVVAFLFTFGYKNIFMEDQATNILIYGLGTLIGLYIFYEIIKGAVKAGTRRQTRAMILWMIKNGMNPAEIKEAIQMDEDDFWKKFEKL
jgi:hypothetical protein